MLPLQVTTLRAICNAFAELLLSLVLVDHAMESARDADSGEANEAQTERDARVTSNIGLLQAAATGARNVGTLASLVVGLAVYQCGAFVGLNARLIIGGTAAFSVIAGICAFFLQDGPANQASQRRNSSLDSSRGIDTSKDRTDSACDSTCCRSARPSRKKKPCRCTRKGLVSLSLFVLLQFLVVVTILRSSALEDDTSSSAALSTQLSNHSSNATTAAGGSGPAFSPNAILALTVSFWTFLAAMVLLLAFEVGAAAVKKACPSDQGAKTKSLHHVVADAEPGLAPGSEALSVGLLSSSEDELQPDAACNTAAASGGADDGKPATAFWQSKHFILAASFIFLSNAMPTASTQW